MNVTVPLTRGDFDFSATFGAATAPSDVLVLLSAHRARLHTVDDEKDLENALGYAERLQRFFVHYLQRRERIRTALKPPLFQWLMPPTVISTTASTSLLLECSVVAELMLAWYRVAVAQCRQGNNASKERHERTAHYNDAAETVSRRIVVLQTRYFRPRLFLPTRKAARKRENLWLSDNHAQMLVMMLKAQVCRNEASALVSVGPDGGRRHAAARSVIRARNYYRDCIELFPASMPLHQYRQAAQVFALRLLSTLILEETHQIEVAIICMRQALQMADEKMVPQLQKYMDELQRRNRIEHSYVPIPIVRVLDIELSTDPPEKVSTLLDPPNKLTIYI